MQHIDDPALDTRLTFIRRHSGLDSRAALFVLSPVSQSELGEFVKRYVRLSMLVIYLYPYHHLQFVSGAL
jgi:hypothetical protein